MRVLERQDLFVANFVAQSIPGIRDSRDWGPHTAVGFSTDRSTLPLTVGAVFTNFVGFDVTISLACVSGERITRDMLRYLGELVFNQWKCKRVTAVVAKRNKPGRKLVERLGFKLEGVKEKGYDGRQDAMLYGMLKENCRWI